ncbi:MAG: iron ABC transporter permease [Bacteroidales bacterium]|nr:iron ABC transporter permease [Bacteroidales bacterium]MBN2756822.1 iron ABC transporter permease [Bacteroidales bacterium]
MNSRFSLYIFILVIFFTIFFILDLFIGSVSIPFKEIFKILFSSTEVKQEYHTIIIDFRLPKAITAVLSGAALSVSGLQMQTIFKNPLAGPYVLGISSGASLGVAILVLGATSIFSVSNFYLYYNWSVIFAAWIGAAIILLLILLVSTRISDIMTILILGILLGSAITAIVSILQYFSSETALKSFIIWTFGSLGSVTKSQLQLLLPAVFLGLLISIFSIKILNGFLLGETYAVSIGMNIKFARAVIFVSTSILAGSVTAFCGPIGFVGIAVPHFARILFKTADHRILLIASIFFGSIFMIIADIISQLPGFDNILPINSVTALLGIPVILWIIIKNKRIF